MRKPELCPKHGIPLCDGVCLSCSPPQLRPDFQQPSAPVFGGPFNGKRASVHNHLFHAPLPSPLNVTPILKPGLAIPKSMFHVFTYRRQHLLFVFGGYRFFLPVFLPDGKNPDATDTGRVVSRIFTCPN